MIRAHSITVRRGGRTLLDDVALTIRPGELVALCGPNGAGKSTLLKVLSGELRPATGGVTLHGEPITRLTAPQLARRRAVLPQRYDLAFDFTVAQVVSLGRLPWGDRPDEAEAAVHRALDQVGLVHAAHRAFPRLSGGEQQRVQLARVPCQLEGMQSGALFLDEPTSALDLQYQVQVMERARAVANSGAMVIAVLHDLNLASLWADRVVLLRAGHLISEGHPRDTFNPTNIAAIYGIVPHRLCHPDTERPILAHPRKSLESS